jgi:hypothetical protein
MKITQLICLIFGFSFFSCGQKGTAEQASANTETMQKTSKTPDFNADSAYTFVANQVEFGPRVPNTPEHVACGDYLIRELERFGAKVFIQEAVLTAFNGTKLQSRNIIGSYDPDNKKRVMLFAHWDTRPFADQDIPANHYTPIDGADDGASGVGALLEIARQINANSPGYGIDIIFFDSEDYGTPTFERIDYSQTWYCLGSQFWAKNPHVPNYKADFGILLDMVGAKNATFYKEGYSMQKAAPTVEKIWNTARDIGYGRFFMNAKADPITDDHQFVMEGRGIPCVDIIYLDSDTNHSFGPHWHTVNDNMDNISTETLKAVGQTVLEVIYNY